MGCFMAQAKTRLLLDGTNTLIHSCTCLQNPKAEEKSRDTPLAQAKTHLVLVLQVLSRRFFLEYMETTSVGELLSWESKTEDGPKKLGPAPIFRGHAPPSLVTYWVGHNRMTLKKTIAIKNTSRNAHFSARFVM